MSPSEVEMLLKVLLQLDQVHGSDFHVEDRGFDILIRCLGMPENYFDVKKLPLQFVLGVLVGDSTVLRDGLVVDILASFVPTFLVGSLDHFT